MFLTTNTTKQVLTVTMAIFSRQICICVVLFFFMQSISAEEDPETQEKITNILGPKILAWRSYLEGVKFETRKFDHNYQTAVSEAKTSLKTEVDKIINEIKPHAETKQCGNQVTQGIEEITKQSDTIQNNCATSVKPNQTDLNKAITIHNEFQSRFGSSPKNCRDTNNDVASIVKCTEKSVEDIGKEMKESENKINAIIHEIKQKMNELQSTLANCQAKGLEELKNKSKDVKDKFNQCVKT